MMRLRDRFDRSKRKPSTRTQRIGFAFFWLLILAFAYFISPDANFNTESHLYVAFSIVDHGTVNIDAYHQRLGDESYQHGHYYSDKAPGLSFLAVPIYAGLRLAFPRKKGLGYEAYSHHRYAIPKDTVYLRYAITYVLVILPSAIFAILLWLFLSQLIGSTGWALAVAAAYALGSIAYPYSTWFFSHQIAAVLLFSSFLLLHARVQNGAAGRRRLLFTGLAGLFAGYAVICEYPTAIIAVLLGAYATLAAPQAANRLLLRATTLVAFILGMLPPALLNVAYNLAAFGKPFASGYMYVQSDMYRNHVGGGVVGMVLNTVQAPSLRSLWEITFGTYRGLFLLSPFLLLFFVGIAFMWRRRELRPELWLCLAVVILYFLMDASRGMDRNGWSGGWSIASRHLTPMLPFMVLPIAFGLKNRAFRAAFVLLAAVSMVVMFMAVSAGDQFSFADRNPIVNEALPNFFHGKILINWGYMLGLTGLRSLLPFLALALGLVARLLWLLRTSSGPATREMASAGHPLGHPAGSAGSGGALGHPASSAGSGAALGDPPRIEASS